MAILMGVIGYSLFGVAMALMKYGAVFLKQPRSVLSNSAIRNRCLVWLSGCLINFLYVGLVTYALGSGKAAVISSLNGVGLAVLVLLSHFFLKEIVGFPELVGIGVIVCGTVLLGLFDRPSPVEFTFRAPEVLFFSLLTIGIPALGVVYSLAAKFRGAVLNFSVFAGVLGGVSLLYQKIFMVNLLEHAKLASLLRDPYFIAFLVTSNASFIMLQVAYLFGRAVVIVPIFSSVIILTPVLGGVVVFAETLSIAQWIGLGVVVSGIVILTALAAWLREFRS